MRRCTAPMLLPMLLLTLAALSGCTVIAVTSTVIGAGVTVASTAVGAAVAVGSSVVSAGSAVINSGAP